MSINMRSAVKYPAVMLMSVIGSSFFLFPVSAILIGAFLKRKDLPWIGVAMVGANAFWIIPYIILGAPASGEIPSYLSLALLLPILVMTVKVEDRVKVLISLGSIAYLVSGLPYSELAYPVAIASTLIVISGVGIKRILAGVVITLLLITSVLQFANYHGVSIPSNVQEIDKKVDNATLMWWNYSYPLLSPVPINTTQIISQAIQYIVNNQGNVIPNPNYTGFPASFKVIFPRNLTRVNGTWISETYAQYTLNSSFFHIDYKSPNITVNTSYGIVIKSLLGEQFVAWKIPEAENRSTLLVGLTGSWISYSGEPMLFLGYNVSNYSSLAPINFTALTLWLTKAGQIFLYSNHGLRILPRACPIPTSGSFNINFYFIDQGNFTILAGEQINGKFHSLYINTTLPWYEVNAVGLILPIGDELNLTQIQFPQFVPTNVTQNWISWDSPVPFKISFYPNKPLNGTIYLASKRPVFMEVNGIPASNGSTFLNASNITLISGPGFVNVTSIYFIHNGTREYIVGTYPINLTYLVKINPLLGGEKIVVQSHISLNMTVIPLGLVYKLDGIPLNVSDTAVLRPGTHVLEILYPGQAYLIIGLYFTFLSFVIAMLSEILKNSLTQIRTFINKILYKVEKNEG
ncbi:hypothetical protein L3N51_02267 [Metallosphaera sp. J1]|nr:hypothetical protein [Metallosphaera javensis (ex Hofmann et al. 2022)]